MKKVLEKISGDLNKHQTFLSFTERKARENYVAVITGGGTQINEALRRAGYQVQFDEHGRVTATSIEREIARDVLEKEAKKLKNRFLGKGIVVLRPFLYAGSVLCHINADNLVKAYYLGFDEIYVFTLKERTKAKEKVFADYQKVKIIPL